MGFASRVFRYLPFNAKTKKYLKFLYFKSAAIMGVVRSPALVSLDLKLESYLPKRGGVFIEAGANDGISQSNTWHFESYKGWSGLLVEPLPTHAKMASLFRKAPVANVALGPRDGGTLELAEFDLMSTADLSRVNSAMSRVFVPVRTISSLWDEYDLGPVDLFSLDVEGFEIQVLLGLDLKRHKPHYILVETADIDAVLEVLSGHYVVREILSHHDYLLCCAASDQASAA